jgi:tetratricopeptide (TPR) repeat protein
MHRRPFLKQLGKAYNDITWMAFIFGKREEAIQYWKEALKINPGNKASKYYLKKYGS